MKRINKSMVAGTVLRVLAAVLLVLAVVPAGAQSNGDANGWEYDLLIYGWLPEIEGTLSQEIPGSGNQLEVDAGDLLDTVELTAQLAFQARRDRWYLLADVLWVDQEAKETGQVVLPGGVLDAEARLDVNAWILNLNGGRVFVEGKRGELGLLFGARYLTLDSDLGLQLDPPLPEIPTRLSRDVDLWDAVVGIQGHLRAGDHWFFPYRLDVGAGDSDLTWLALAGFGYRFGWGSVFAAYQSLNYEQDGKGLLKDVAFRGPALAVGFRF
jgi:hypothetical protein